VDLATATGADIPIEERAPIEVLAIRGVRIAPPETEVRNPAFDVTPAELIGGIVTEEGVLRTPFDETLVEAVASRERRRSAAPGFAALTASDA
jgi:methylthioribose-1-phosphate isomerase